MIVYYIHYLLVFIISGFSVYKRKIQSITAIVIFLILFLFAALRGPHVGRDYVVYVDYFQKFMGDFEYFSANRPLFYEPSFFFIPYICYQVVGAAYYVIASFVIFAALGVFFKVKSFYLSNSFFLSAILYLSNFYLLHEMTQIRVGVATGILLYNVGYLYKKEFGKYVLLILFACFFHYSSLLFLLFIFLDTDRINKWAYLSIFILILGVVAAKINIFSLPIVQSISPKIQLYAELAAKGGKEAEINIWTNAGFLSNCFVTLVLLLQAEKIKQYNIYFIVMLKINLIAIFIFLVFSPVPVIAMRISQLCGVVQICLFPSLIFAYKEKWLGYLILIGISLMYFYNYILRLEMFNPYYTWLFQ